MELNADNTSSDKDAQMQSSFESYANTEKKDEKEKSKKRKRGLFELLNTESKESDKKAKDQQSEVKREESKPFNTLFKQQEQEESTEEAASIESLGELTEEEVTETARQIVEARDEDLLAELQEVEPDSPQEAEVLAASLLNERFKENIAQGETDEAALDQSFEEAARELELLDTDESAADLLTDENDPESEEDSTPDDLETIPDEAATIESESEDDESNDETSGSTSTTSSASASMPSSQPSSGQPVAPTPGGSGGGAVPPAPYYTSGIPPTPPTQPGSETTPDPSQAAEAAVFRYESRRRRGADLLVGGIIGYMIGRRRGRIKTEERLMPIQESLEKQVRDLDEKLAIREQKIRVLAAESVAREGEDKRREIADRVEARARARQEQRERQSLDALENRSSNHHVLTKLPEQLVSVVVPKSEVLEVNRTASPEVKPPVSDLDVMRQASEIVINGMNMRVLYEQGRLTKDDLRLLVVENERGAHRLEQLFYERLRPSDQIETYEKLRTPGSYAAGDVSGTQQGNESNEQPSSHSNESHATSMDHTGLEQRTNSMNALNGQQDQSSTKQLVVTMVLVGLGISLVIGIFLF